MDSSSARSPSLGNPAMPGESAQARLECAIDLVEAALKAARESISREICEIPSPIPGCDANVNQLLEDRARVVDALQALAQMRARRVTPSRFMQFVASCAGLDQPTRARVASMLDSGSSA